MNKVYRVIWNASLGQWIVTSELGQAGKKNRQRNQQGNRQRSLSKAFALGATLGLTALTTAMAQLTPITIIKQAGDKSFVGQSSTVKDKILVGVDLSSASSVVNLELGKHTFTSSEPKQAYENFAAAVAFGSNTDQKEGKGTVNITAGDITLKDKSAIALNFQQDFNANQSIITIGEAVKVTMDGNGSQAIIARGFGREHPTIAKSAMIINQGTIDFSNASQNSIALSTLRGGYAENRGIVNVLAGSNNMAFQAISAGTVENAKEGVINVGGTGGNAAFEFYSHLSGYETKIINRGTVTITDSGYVLTVRSGESAGVFTADETSNITLNDQSTFFKPFGSSTLRELDLAGSVVSHSSKTALDFTSASINQITINNAEFSQKSDNATFLKINNQFNKATVKETTLTVSGDNAVGIEAVGSGTVQLSDGFTVISESDTATLVQLNGSATLINHAHLSGDQGKGIIAKQGSIDNQGTILFGKGVAVELAQSSGSLKNSGTIEGDILLGEGNYSVDLLDSGSFIGDLEVNAKESSKNTITIDGATNEIGNISANAGNLALTLKNGVNAAKINVKGTDDESRLTLDNNDYVVESGSLSGFNHIALSNDSKLTAKEALDAEGSLDLQSAGSELAVEMAGDVQLNARLIGEGKVTITLTDVDDQFSFGNGTEFGGKTYTGLLDLNSGRLILDQIGVINLENAAMTIHSDGALVVRDRSKTLNSIDITNGALHLEGATLESLKVKRFSLADGATITFNRGSDAGSLDISDISIFDKIIDRDNALVEADHLTGADSQFDWKRVDEEGNEVTGDITQTLTKDGDTLGKATYKDYEVKALNDEGKESGGIYLGYLLSELEAYLGQSIDIDNSETDKTAFDVKLTGEGGFTFTPDGEKTIVVSGNNDYQGDTTINGGTVLAGIDNAFGSETGGMELTGNATLDLNSYEQTVSSLKGSAESTVDLETTGSQLIVTGETTLEGDLKLGDGGHLSLGDKSKIDGAITGNEGSTLDVKGGNLHVTSDNADFAGTTTIDEKATATLDHATGLGKGDINLSGDLSVGGKGDFTNQLNGAGGLTIAENADLTMSQDNSNFTGKLSADGKVTINDIDSIGHGEVSINETGEFVFGTDLKTNAEDHVEFNNDMSGAGKVTVGDNAVIAKGNDSNFIGNIDLDQPSSEWVVGQGSNLDADGGYTLNYGVSGDGSFVVNLNDKNANFTVSDQVKDRGTGFAGNVQVASGNANLDQHYYDQFGGGDLSLSSDGKATINSTGKIDGDLNLNGGTVHIKENDGKFNQLEVGGEIKVDSSSQIMLDGMANIETGSTEINQDQSFLDQQESAQGNVLIKGNVADGGDTLKLVDKDGVAIETGHKSTIDIDGGSAEYDFKGLSASDGIYLDYGLTKLTADAESSIKIDSTDSSNKKLGVELQGDGGFNFITDSDGLTVSNVNNDYKGDSNISGGTVTLGGDGALGKGGQGNLNLDNSGGIDLAGHTQIVEGLDAKAGTSVNINDGELIINNGGTLAGDLVNAGDDGQLTVNGGDLAITQGNDQFNGKTDIGNHGSITLTETNGLGSGAIQNDGTLNLEGEGEFSNSLSGDTTGNLTINGGQVVLDNRDNSDYKGNLTITEKGDLLVKEDINALGNGEGTLTINKGGKLGFEGLGSDKTLANDLRGEGDIDVDEQSEITVLGSDNNFTGSVTLNDEKSKWIVGNNGDHGFDANYDFKGAGDFVVNLTDQENQFNFGSGNAHDLTGNLVINNGQINIDDKNVTGLGENAGLTLGQDATGIVDTDQTIAELTLDGGMIDVSKENDFAIVGDLVISEKGGNIKVDKDRLSDGEGIESNGNIFEQQAGIAGDTIIHSGGVVAGDNNENLGNLILVDDKGETIISLGEISQDIDGGKAYYDYNGLTAGDDGLHINYGLNKIIADKDGTIVIDQEGYQPGKLTVDLQGDGNFTIIADNDGEITLEGNNNYTGKTELQGGKITAGNDHALGDTSELTIKGETEYDLNGHDQTVGGLNSDADSSISINGGNLTITDGGTIEGTLKDGEIAGGTIIVEESKTDGNELTIIGDNSELTANTEIQSGGVVNLDNVNGLGSGGINNDGSINLTGNGDFNNQLTSSDGETSGSLTIGGGSDINLNGDNQDYSGSIIVDEDATVNVTDITGLGQGAIINEGDLNLNGLGEQDFLNDLSGAGDITLTDSQLTVTGNELGNGEDAGFTGTINLVENDQDNPSQWIIDQSGKTGDYTLDYTVTGNGDFVIKLDEMKNDFIFGEGNTHGLGHLDLDTGTIHLNEDQFGKLGNDAGISVQEDGKLVIEQEGTIKDLNLNGGTIHLTNRDQNEPSDPNEGVNKLHVDGDITIDSGSTILLDDLTALDGAAGNGTINPNPTEGNSFFDQQAGGQTGEKIITGNVKPGTEGTQIDLDIVDLKGGSLDDLKTSEELDDGTGTAHYEYKGIATDGGVSIDYGLSGLEANKDKQIIIDADDNGKNDKLNIHLSGEGGFIINSDDDGITLNNSKNDYTGKTDFNGGKVIADQNNAFGNTSDLNMSDDAEFDLNGNDQTVGQLHMNDKTTQIDLNEGNLTILDGGKVDGQLTGNGSLTIDGQAGGELDIEGEQSGLTGDIIVKDDGVVNLNDYQGLGSGGIENDGVINLAVDGDGEFSNDLTAGKDQDGNITGNVNFTGKGDVEITGDNSSYEGNITIGKDQNAIVDNSGALGNGGGVNIDGNLTIHDATEPSNDFNQNFVGDGNISLEESDVILSGNNSGHTGELHIDKESNLTTHNEGSSNGNVINDGAWNIHVDEDKSIDYNGSLSGNGDLNKWDEGDFTINGDAQDFGGNILVDNGDLNIGNGVNLGNGNGNLVINNDGALNGGDQSDINVNEIEINDNGNLNISDKGGLTGKDLVINDQGHLNMGNDSTGSLENIIINDQGSFNMGDGSSLTGKDVALNDQGQMHIGKDSELNVGDLHLKDESYLTMDHGSTINSNVTVDSDAKLGGAGTIDGNLNLAGHLDVGSRVNKDEALRELIITGDLIGQSDSLIHFGSDQTNADKLIVKGNASGATGLIVDDIHGFELEHLGEGILEIELIKIEGENEIEIEQILRSTGGAYDYKLVKGDDGKWILTNSDGHLAGELLYRPESGAYISGLSSANKLFSHSLSDRNYTHEGSRIWTRMYGSTGKFSDSTKQNRTRTNQFTMQIGGDFLQTTMGNSSLSMGAMFGYGYSSSKTINQKTGYSAKASGDGYSAGIYATLGEMDGAYLDASLQYVYFKNRIKGDYLANDRATVKGFVASIEGGYAFDLGNSIHLQPQAQLTWMGAKMNDLYEQTSGTKVTGSSNNLETRLGVRLFGDITLNNGATVKPYMELNYIHNTKENAVYMDGIRVGEAGTRNMGQAKLGFEARINPQTKVWGDLSHSRGSHRYHDSKVSVGIQYNF